MTRKGRHNRYRENKYCFWCGIEMTLEHTRGERQPDNLATIDHIYHKGHPFRKKFRNLVVLACRRCNTDREFIFRTIYKGKETRAQYKSHNNIVLFPITKSNRSDLDVKLDKYIREYYEKLVR